MRNEHDPRPTVGVFLASGQEFFAVRSRFEQMIDRLTQLPNIARSYKLTPVHWQQGGGETQENTLQKQIESSVRFEEVPILLILIGSYIGAGTREEYETAVSLRREHGVWPKILVLFKCHENGVTLLGNEDVQAFHRQVISDGLTVPVHFRNEAELEERLADRLQDLLPRVPKTNPSRGERLRRSFFNCAITGIAISTVAIFMSSTMAFPENNVSEMRVLTILAAPPVLFVIGGFTLWLFHQLIQEFQRAWNSISYSDEHVFEIFRLVFPPPIIPQPLRKRFADSPLATMPTFVLLILIFGAPLAAQFDCIFKEILQWDYVIDPHILLEDPTSAQSSKQAPAHSRYVERGPIKWPYQLSNQEVVQQYRANSSTIYVYAVGQFGTPNSDPQQPFRRNIGPQVFLPWQPLIYAGMLTIHTAITIWLLLLLVKLAKSVRSMADPKPEK